MGQPPYNQSQFILGFPGLTDYQQQIIAQATFPVNDRQVITIACIPDNTADIATLTDAEQLFAESIGFFVAVYDEGRRTAKVTGQESDSAQPINEIVRNVVLGLIDTPTPQFRNQLDKAIAAVFGIHFRAERNTSEKRIIRDKSRSLQLKQLRRSLP